MEEAPPAGTVDGAAAAAEATAEDTAGAAISEARPAGPDEAALAAAAWPGRVGLTFPHPELLVTALTHRSYVREHPGANLEPYERLEFLGDTILGLVVSEYLFHSYPDFAEGELSKVKAVAVSEPVLHEAAREAALGPCIRMSHAEAAAGGRDRPSILSDTFEAVVAAIYLDCGMYAAEHFVMRFLGEHVRSIARHEHERDFKTAFQEVVQSEGLPTPTYRIISQEGPDHRKVFTAEAKIGRRVFGRGTGKSKKESEQAAARDALEKRAARRHRAK